MAETRVQQQVRLVLEQQCRELATLLKERVPAGVGFALFIFDYGEKGNLAYVATAQRDDMRRAILEWLERTEESPPAQGDRR